MKSPRLHPGIALVGALGALLSGCRSTRLETPPAAHTLAADHRLPVADIERLY